MAKSEAAISVTHVAKDFVLPQARNNTVKSMVTNLFHSSAGSGAEPQHALRDISLEIKKGEFFGILGRNGSGKSTLLKILAGIYQPTKGKVETRGKLVPFIELGVGFNPELTGRENVFLNGAMLGFSQKEVADMYDDIVAFAELEKFMDQKLKNYSSGMQVRLAFSMATRAQADILLVDEVLAVGDADFQRKCFQYFKQLKGQKKTVVFVTHDMNAVREYCDRAILIENGNIVYEGVAGKVANQYLKLFNTSAATSSAEESPDRWGDGRVKFGKITARYDKDGVHLTTEVRADDAVKDVVVGIRIKDSTGRVITGANTFDVAQIIMSLDKGAEKKLEWIVPDIFSNGVYGIDATLRLSDGVTICDNWDDAASFEVFKDIRTPYLTSPDIAVKEA